MIGELLASGTTRPDRSGRPILYRYLSPTDDLELLTSLLHEAYAPLAAAGMRFVASYQDVSVTRRRTEKGETIVATHDGAIVGVITLADADKTGGSPYYDLTHVSSVGQFAVNPSYQGAGIGATLLRLAEERAREKGSTAVGLDTSEHAAHLVAFYRARGYQFIEYTQWRETNYRSMVFGKALSEP